MSNRKPIYYAIISTYDFHTYTVSFNKNHKAGIISHPQVVNLQYLVPKHVNYLKKVALPNNWTYEFVKPSMLEIRFNSTLLLNAIRKRQHERAQKHA